MCLGICKKKNMAHTIKDCEQCGADYMYHNNESEYEKICQSCYQKNKELMAIREDLQENNYVVDADQLLYLFLSQMY
jgi:uncharacterized Zn ribbon protein